MRHAPARCYRLSHLNSYITNVTYINAIIFRDRRQLRVCKNAPSFSCTALPCIKREKSDGDVGRLTEIEYHSLKRRFRCSFTFSELQSSERKSYYRISSLAPYPRNLYRDLVETIRRQLTSTHSSGVQTRSSLIRAVYLFAVIRHATRRGVVTCLRPCE